MNTIPLLRIVCGLLVGYSLIASPELSAQEQCVGSYSVERGKPNKVIDGLGWVVGIPGKLALWNRRVDNHHVSPETEAMICRYLEQQQIDGVKVRVNQYDPLGEWQRLSENQQVGAGWRYTFGALNTLGYTIFPGRVFGGDNYNPFTNTLNIYSDVPSIALAESAYAGNVRSRNYPGTYAVSQIIPGVNVHHHTLALRDTFDYLKHHESPEQVREAYHVLYPRYGANVGAAVDSYIVIADAGGVFNFSGLILGHAYGRYQSNSYSDSVQQALSQPENDLLVQLTAQ